MGFKIKPLRFTPASLRQIELQLSQLFQAAGNLVAGFEPNVLLLGNGKPTDNSAEDHSSRRAGEDDVSRPEGNAGRGIADDLAAAVDQVVGVRRLAGFAIDPAFQVQIVGINLLGGDEIRAQGGKAVRRLALHPLAAGFELKVARTEIVAGRVSATRKGIQATAAMPA